MEYSPVFCFWPCSEARVHCVTCVFYLPLCARALCQICVARVSCVNTNKFEHVRIFKLRQLCNHPCAVASTVSPCVTYLPLYFLLHQKGLSTDTMDTRPKRTAGARLNFTPSTTPTHI